MEQEVKQKTVQFNNILEVLLLKKLNEGTIKIEPEKSSIKQNKEINK